MQVTRRSLLFLLGVCFAGTALPVFAQQVIATVTVGSIPYAAAVNPATNKAYIVDFLSRDVTVIDGATNQTTTVTVGTGPVAVAVNSVTNQIYVANQNSKNVTVIDGATNQTTTITVGTGPGALAINSVTNKIYVANSGNGTVTVIDGVTNSTASVTVGSSPVAVAVNSVTNKIYVANFSSNNLTMIDGATNNTTTVTVGTSPVAVAVNSATNKIYVVNQNSKNVTVVDGATNNTTTVAVGTSPVAAAVDQVTNKIYVANSGNGTVTIIDGATDSPTATVTVESKPNALAADPVTNKVYVVNSCGADPTCQSNGSVTAIDGATNNTVTVPVQLYPTAVAANLVTNRIYVTNYDSDSVSVIAGANANPLQFVAVSPCRLVDTRFEYGGNGPILGGTSQSFPVPQLGGCNIPTTAAAYSLNVTVVPHGFLGYLTVWPTGEDQPLVSTLNSYDGRVKANAAIVPAGYQDAVSVYAYNTTDLVLDIDGYFAPVSGSTLAFYPLTPCRVADTRNPIGDLGGPYLTGGVPRDFPVLESGCSGLPTDGSAKGYSLNFTVVPHGPLGYLTVWPTGQSQPLVSTLNAPTGATTANAAIVPEGNGGDVSTYALNDTDLIIDIDGYFAAPGTGGLSLYPVAPCRVLDTRPHPFQFGLNPPVDVLGSVCAPSNQSKAYVFNATVVPQGGLGYLTLWPDGGSQPLVSTLNAADGAVTSNLAIVPANPTNGKVDAYAYPVNPNDPNDLTDLILDISSYFAP